MDLWKKFFPSISQLEVYMIDGFYDSSDPKDLFPSLSSSDSCFKIYIDHPDLALRASSLMFSEQEPNSRFLILDNQGEKILSCELWEDVVSLISSSVYGITQ